MEDGSIRDTVARTGLAQSRVSTSVAGFVRRGWVSTEADPNDGRRTIVRVSPDVRRIGEQRRAGGAADALTEALSGITARERRELVGALDRLHELLLAQHAP